MSTNARFSAALVALRCSIAVAVVFLCTVVGSSFPPRLLRYSWQYDLANTIRTSTPLAMLAIALLLLAVNLNLRGVVASRYFRLVRRIGVWIAIGYFLLIPWQFTAGYFELQRLDFAERNELAAVSEVLDRVAKAGSPDQLRAVIATVPVLAQQVAAQPDALANFSEARSNLITNGRANLNKVRTEAKQKSRLRYRRFWFVSVQNTLILAVYGWAFWAMGVELKKMRVQYSSRLPN